MTTDFKNQVVLITGGSKGIGFGIATAFAKRGCALRLVARDEKSLQQAQQQLVAEYGVDVQTMAVNLSEDKNIDQLEPFFAKTTILVNSAGAMGRGSLFEIDPTKFRDAWEGKVMSTIFLTRRVYPFMKLHAHGGVIINIIGIAAERLNAKSIGTSTANIRVVGISPGLIRTTRTESILNPTNEVDRKAYAKLVGNLPYGRMGEPSEIAELAVFLASEHGKYLSGEVINVDGGARYRY